MLRHPNLAKAVGSALLARRMEQLRPDVHVFGHTHFSYDTRLHGTRFVQWPLGYPAEQRCLPTAQNPVIASFSGPHYLLLSPADRGGHPFVQFYPHRRRVCRTESWLTGAQASIQRWQ